MKESRRPQTKREDVVEAEAMKPVMDTLVEIKKEQTVSTEAEKLAISIASKLGEAAKKDHMEKWTVEDSLKELDRAIEVMFRSGWNRAHEKSFFEPFIDRFQEEWAEKLESLVSISGAEDMADTEIKDWVVHHTAFLYRACEGLRREAEVINELEESRPRTTSFDYTPWRERLISATQNIQRVVRLIEHTKKIVEQKDHIGGPKTLYDTIGKPSSDKPGITVLEWLEPPADGSQLEIVSIESVADIDKEPTN